MDTPCVTIHFDTVTVDDETSYVLVLGTGILKGGVESLCDGVEPDVVVEASSVITERYATEADREAVFHGVVTLSRTLRTHVLVVHQNVEEFEIWEVNCEAVPRC